MRAETYDRLVVGGVAALFVLIFVLIVSLVISDVLVAALSLGLL